MKNLLIIGLVLIGISVFGQDKKQISIQAVKDFVKLSADFKETKDLYDKATTKFKDLKNRLDVNSDQKNIDSLKSQLGLSQKLLLDLDTHYVLYESYKTVYLNKGVSKETIDSLFNYQYIVSKKVVANSADEPKPYLYFGKNQVIEEFKPTANKKYDEIISTILSKESEAYLGDITIPRDLQEFQFYKASGNAKEQYITDTKSYRFKSISFEILDGFISDIKVFVLDEKGSQQLFENRSPVSILNYSKIAPKNFIFYKHPTNQKGIVSFKEIENLRIRLSDVLMYVSKPGYNFIPNDVTFEFPTKDNENEPLNKNSAIKYEIKENTSLQNAVEFRTYTDFLGLFSDAPNGIVQFEGKGDFYLFPFTTGWSRSDIRMLDKVSPYVNFSKIDDDVRAVRTVNIGTTNITPANNLELVQKSYLEMGAKINLFNVRFTKETPFRLIAYSPIRFQISDIKINEEFKNIQGFAYGIGLTAEIKRFNNFGFNYSFEISKYTFKDQNKVETFVSPDAFGVLRNEAEIFYFPGKEKTQSIFLKLKTFNNLSNNEAFYQLQFGYRFSIGLSNVKTKTK